MANWRNKISVRQLYEQADEDESTCPALAAEIAKQLRALVNVPTAFLSWRDSLADQFEGAANNPGTGHEQINALMDQLYDWGDVSIGNEKLCWIGAAL